MISDPPADPDDVESLRCWLALLHTPGAGPATFRRLLDAGIDLRSLVTRSEKVDAAGSGLSTEILRHLRSPDWGAVDRDLEWAEHNGHHILKISARDYPDLLREIPDPPPVLFVRGDPAVLHRPQLAIVGSRNPSTGGASNAMEFARYLAAGGFTITSGLAIGIDAQGHRGALDGGGYSIAVMGTGPDRVYPASNAGLAAAIADRGALVTEFPPGTPVKPGNFPRRNRVISGLSLGTLVVEAATHSGSLITARHALEQGREVFAIPGSIHNPLARGCHALIRQGAKLVETAQDILEELAPLPGPPPVAESQQTPADSGDELAPEYRKLLDLMGFESVSVDALVAGSGLTPEAVSSMLLILELRQFVASGPGGRYCRTRKGELK